MFNLDYCPIQICHNLSTRYPLIKQFITLELAPPFSSLLCDAKLTPVIHWKNKITRRSTRSHCSRVQPATFTFLNNNIYSTNALTAATLQHAAGLAWLGWLLHHESWSRTTLPVLYELAVCVLSQFCKHTRPLLTGTSPTQVTFLKSSSYALSRNSESSLFCVAKVFVPSGWLWTWTDDITAITVIVEITRQWGDISVDPLNYSKKNRWNFNFQN